MCFDTDARTVRRKPLLRRETGGIQMEQNGAREVLANAICDARGWRRYTNVRRHVVREVQADDLSVGLFGMLLGEVERHLS